MILLFFREAWSPTWGSQPPQGRDDAGLSGREVDHTRGRAQAPRVVASPLTSKDLLFRLEKATQLLEATK